MSKIIYIAGYGRSGSTALDIKLGELHGVIGLGEIAELYKDYSSTLKCSCGSKYSQCALWSSVDKNQLKQLEAVLSRYDASPFLFSSQVKNYKLVSDDLFRTIDSFYGDGVIYVDSSKTAWHTLFRPVKLKTAGNEVFVVHLIRPLKDVLNSVSKGTNKALQGYGREKPLRRTRATIGWFVANISAYINRLIIGRKNSILIKQVELMKDPQKVINTICNKFRIEVNYSKKSQLQHRVGGNRLKYR